MGVRSERPTRSPMDVRSERPARTTMGGVSRLPIALLLLVVIPPLLFLTVTAAPVSRTGRACALDCCALEPNCSAARSVTCQCPRRKIILNEEFVPKTVQEIVVKDTPHVIFEKSSLDDSTNPIALKISVQNVRLLELQERSLWLLRKSSPVEFAVEDVDKVQIRGSAFSGFWNRVAKLTFRSINLLQIHENGFSFTSRPGPKLTLENINELALNRNSFKATIRHLVVYNVSRFRCEQDSFGKHIDRIEMDGVKIQRLGTRCLTSDGALKELVFKNCSIEQLHTQGIHGTIGELTLQDTEIQETKKNGLNVSVDHLHVADSRFGELPSSALNVVSRGTIQWERVTIGRLRSGAFVNMRVGGNQKKSSSSFVFRELTVEHAENGSLAFGDGGDFSMTELNITPPEQVVCRLKHWFRALIGKEESSPLTEMEELVVRQLNEKGHCPTPKLARITTTTTTGAAETTTERAGVRTSPADRSDARSEVIAGHPRPEPADTAAQLDVSRLTLFLAVGIAAVLAVSAGLAVWLLVCSKKGGDPRNRRI